MQLIGTVKTRSRSRTLKVKCSICKVLNVQYNDFFFYWQPGCMGFHLFQHLIHKSYDLN